MSGWIPTAIGWLSPYSRAANICFFTSALFTDVLAIKICVLLAYIGLGLNALYGTPALLVDGICWACICFILHANTVIRLVRDELPVKLADAEEEQMWRMFNRHSGMERLEMREVLRRGSWLHVRKGQRVVAPTQMVANAYLIVEGVISFTTMRLPQRSANRLLRSGQFFPLCLFNVFGVYIGFDHNNAAEFEAWAETDAVLFCWPLTALHDMATNISPAMASYWRSMLLYTMAHTMQSRFFSSIPPRCSTGEPEPDAWFLGARSRDFTDPPRPDEGRQRPSFRRFFQWLRRSINPFPPPGLRHTALPMTGVTARTRTFTLLHAHEQTVQMNRVLSEVVDQDEEGLAGMANGSAAALAKLCSYLPRARQDALEDALATGRVPSTLSSIVQAASGGSASSSSWYGGAGSRVTSAGYIPIGSEVAGSSYGGTSLSDDDALRQRLLYGALPLTEGGETGPGAALAEAVAAQMRTKAEMLAGALGGADQLHGCCCPCHVQSRSHSRAQSTCPSQVDFDMGQGGSPTAPGPGST